MNNEKKLKELISKLFETEELYDELYKIIEKIESESLKPDDNNIHSIYYDPQDKTFDAYEFTDHGSYPACDRLIHIISIDNQYNDEFWSEFEEVFKSDDYTEDDYINDIVDCEFMDFLMESVKTNLKDELSSYQY